MRGGAGSTSRWVSDIQPGGVDVLAGGSGDARVGMGVQKKGRRRAPLNEMLLSGEEVGGRASGAGRGGALMMFRFQGTRVVGRLA